MKLAFGPGILLAATSIILAAAVLPPVSATAEVSDPLRIIIRHVHLPDRDGAVEDVSVCIVIEDGDLDLVTADEVPAQASDVVVDAADGVLLGSLDIGEPASFLILDRDPRDHPEALLDTKAHAVFAIHRGTVLKNELDEEEAVTEPQPPRWFAYTPPPVALPLSYQESGKWNMWRGRYISGLVVGAIALDRQNWLSQDAASREQVGDLETYDGGEVRAFRIGAVGTLNFKRPWGYTVFVASRAYSKGFDAITSDSLVLFDLRLDIPLSDTLTLGLGKQKEPISMERVTGGLSLPIQERSSPADGFFPSRNVGAVLSGTGFDRRVSWATGVFNDWLDASQSFDESATQVVGRLTGLPFVSGDESNLFHLGLGLRHTDAKEGIRYRATPEFYQAPAYVDTGEDRLEADSALTWDLEASWRWGPLWVASEYIQSHVQAPLRGDPVFKGYSVTASWILSGEMRSYDRRNGTFGPVVLSRPVDLGGIGSWEVALRYSRLDLSEQAVTGGDMEVYSLAVNWTATSMLRATLNYRHIVLDRGGLVGRSDGLSTMLGFVLE